MSWEGEFNEPTEVFIRGFIGLTGQSADTDWTSSPSLTFKETFNSFPHNNSDY